MNLLSKTKPRNLDLKKILLKNKIKSIHINYKMNLLSKKKPRNLDLKKKYF